MRDKDAYEAGGVVGEQGALRDAVYFPHVARMEERVKVKVLLQGD